MVELNTNDFMFDINFNSQTKDKLIVLKFVKQNKNWKRTLEFKKFIITKVIKKEIIEKDDILGLSNFNIYKEYDKQDDYNFNIFDYYEPLEYVYIGKRYISEPYFMGDINEPKIEINNKFYFNYVGGRKRIYEDNKNILN